MQRTHMTHSLIGAAFAAAVAAGPMVAPSLSAEDKITLTGCLVHAEGDGDPYLLTNGPTTPALTRGADRSVEPTGVGTSGEFRTVFYWLHGDSQLKDHVGHQVEIEGDVKGDVKEGEIKLDRKDNWTELEVKADGDHMKARVPNQSIFAPKDKDQKGTVAVRRVDVEHIRMIAATCER
jgi:hypothetical protein